MVATKAAKQLEQYATALAGSRIATVVRNRQIYIGEFAEGSPEIADGKKFSYRRLRNGWAPTGLYVHTHGILKPRRATFWRIPEKEVQLFDKLFESRRSVSAKAPSREAVLADALEQIMRQCDRIRGAFDLPPTDGPPALPLST
jgi:hypothetical protein